ncbi:DUF3179 domain-containing protein [Halobaculum magnesiiphilum]|uniref:DUF3179 domain-containing protein n=1 Tax=Halobaculum magnesiiphilum TaxID=1017351 RepID=A0A8T8WE42_9EURY|nr:DUF3179 domain-containing protein [Halobaculum magnesiiphilum]QZP38120.1 DUF3179 domain-containing protein [Halobaculum magnesiiphilum]
MQRALTRRRLLGALGLTGSTALSGCVGGISGRGDGAITAGGVSGPPQRDGPLYQPWDRETVREAVVDGGPGKDGIPSVDDPSFAPASDAELADDEVVFGYAGAEDVKAYTQRVLVWHEIANDTLDGTPVAVTYCPLTGTAMGFERGETTLGVSGRLVNNNLVMYDRATDSRWPQVLATAVDGPLSGDQLREFRLVWTTWGRWREAHPDTLVLTEETGYAKRYGSDPYGNYNPTSGYYGGGSPLFESLDDGWAERQEDAKRVVIAARTADRALAFDKPALRERGLLASDDGAAVAAYDPRLDTGWVYRTDGVDVSLAEPGRVSVDGERFRADDLPLSRVYGFDAMWHAAGGFYPEVEYVA